jgi:hypothetical protein
MLILIPEKKAEINCRYSKNVSGIPLDIRNITTELSNCTKSNATTNKLQKTSMASSNHIW